MERVDLKIFLGQAATVNYSQNLPENLVISGLSIDSRTIRAGDLYVAIRGDRFDGHQFVPGALKNEALAVVIDTGGDVQLRGKKIPKIVVSDCVDFLMEFAGWYREQYAIPVIGITGSAGKTTTKEMLAAVLATTFNIRNTQGNRNNFIGVSLTLLNIDSLTEVAVVEMGTNHPGEIAKLTSIVQPTHAAITNIGSGHIGNFGSREAIFQEKTALPEGLKKNCIFYRNIDDPALRNYSREGIQIKDYGLEAGAEFRGKSLGISELGQVRFRLNQGPEIQLKIPGKHHLSNALLAAAIGLDLGISPERIKTALESVEPATQRMEYFSEDGILFINDAYNSNPESLKAAIDFLSELPLHNGNRRFLVIGDMLELGGLSETLHREIGKYLLDKPIHFVFGFGKKSRIICELLAKEAGGKIDAEWFAEYQQVATAVHSKINAGDIILLKGSRAMSIEKVLNYLTVRN